MTARRKIVAIATVAAVGALAGGVAAAVGRSDDDTAGEERAERAQTRDLLDRAVVGRGEAEAAALEAHPGSVLESELEEEGGRLIWEVEVDAGSTLREVTIDATTGEVLGAEIEGAQGGEDR